MQENRIIIKNVKDFDTNHIFQCGQCFRFEQDKEQSNSFTGIAFGRPITVKTEDYNNSRNLIIENTTEEEYKKIWHAFFDMDRDYSEIKSTLRKNDETIGSAIDFGHGIRILQQDKWESIVSFIISQNNNIPRIKGCIEKLCSSFGTFASEYKGKEFYNIPSAKVLASLSTEDLSECKLGYRAKYLIDMSKQIIKLCEDTGSSLEKLDFFDKMSDEEAYKTLICLQGVGPKVANCIMLFGLNRYESFPIDVWVKKVMADLYGHDEKDTKGMTAFAKERFGHYGGFAQQYLFYYMREKDNNLK